MYRLKTHLLILIGAVLSLSCNKDDNDMYKKINANLEEFEKINEPYPYNNLTTEETVDYWELILVNSQKNNKTVFSSGVKCQNATNVNDCLLQFDSTVNVKEGFAYECKPGGCALHIKYQSGDKIALVTNKSQLKAFIGTIDTPADAILFAISEDYTFNIDKKEIGAIRETASGFEILMTKTVSYCTPIQINRFLLEVTKNGTINILGEEKYFTSEACI